MSLIEKIGVGKPSSNTSTREAIEPIGYLCASDRAGAAPEDRAPRDHGTVQDGKRRLPRGGAKPRSLGSAVKSGRENASCPICRGFSLLYFNWASAPHKKYQREYRSGHSSHIMGRRNRILGRGRRRPGITCGELNKQATPTLPSSTKT
jgi:hypothetical protein